MSVFVAEVVVKKFTLKQDIGFQPHLICKQAERILQHTYSNLAARTEGRYCLWRQTLFNFLQSQKFICSVIPLLCIFQDSNSVSLKAMLSLASARSDIVPQLW